MTLTLNKHKEYTHKVIRPSIESVGREGSINGVVFSLVRLNVRAYSV